jgi:hypothetical protein
MYSHFVYFVAIWYFLLSFRIFFRFGMLRKEKSGNPAPALFPIVLAYSPPC